MFKTVTMNSKSQIIITYMVDEILKVRWPNDSGLHMCRTSPITNHIDKHISFDSPDSPVRQVSSLHCIDGKTESYRNWEQCNEIKGIQTASSESNFFTLCYL